MRQTAETKTEAEMVRIDMCVVKVARANKSARATIAQGEINRLGALGVVGAITMAIESAVRAAAAFCENQTAPAPS